MEQKTIYTAIFGDYDTLKEPTVITPGWKYIVFTDQDFKSDIWEIKKVTVPYSPQTSARFYKILFHHHIDTEYSMWIDGSFQINCDLNEWWNKYFVSSITCIKHPWRNCIYEEAKVCIEQKRGDADKITIQMKDYFDSGFQYNQGLIQSGILMRRKCDQLILLCEQWFKEITKYSTRDQLSFSYIFRNYKPYLITDWKYGRDQEFIFSKHIKK